MILQIANISSILSSHTLGIWHTVFYFTTIKNSQHYFTKLPSPVSTRSFLADMSPHFTTLSSPLEDLTKSLVADVRFLTEYLESVGGVQPSFERSTPITVVPQDAPTEAQETREHIMDQCLKILQLVTGPGDYMINIQTGVCFHPKTSYKRLTMDGSTTTSHAYNGYVTSTCSDWCLSKARYRMQTWRV
jgi:hypothetical protein